MTNRSKNVFIAVCVLPAVIVFGIFSLYPFLRAITMAFYSWSGISAESEFIGLDNFRTLAQDPIVWKSLRNNIFLLLVVPVVTMALSLLFAVLLTRKRFRERPFYRTVFFFPNVLALVVISILWSFIYHPTFGILNSFMEAIGLQSLTHAWLGESGTVLWALVFPMVWQAVGYYMIIYIAAMEGVPAHLYESAVLEGATEMQQFLHITFPLIWSVVRITIVFFLIGVFNNSFTYVQVMTNSGPDNESSVLMTYLYKQAMQNGNFGYGAAIGVFTLIVTITLAWLSEKLTDKESVEY
ncbi:carbohydrate ABC transporter permease [Paenibacillus sp. MSJ-34]|uniref:carbohydrate ABC transporter permease n=1 Tax=Paenibacillus sp. MSJ-34 TaxID=2841529 RepID=UPI001C11AD4C|nr:sugar ABC transporter permease [Paenibacillus sp. MSJ-34]MBU5441330.1 sugar ABC transporter permease [Paenibacillus sp. MSJ-34]